MIERIRAFSETLREFEVAFVDLISGAVGGLNSLIPAYFVYHHLQAVMGIPWPVAMVFGVLMALLEFSLLSRFFEAYQYRKKYAESTAKGSVDPRIPLATFGAYIVVIIMVNGVLAFFDTIPEGEQSLSQAMLELSQNWGAPEYRVSRLVPALVQTSVVFLLSLLSIPGAISVVLGHQQRLHMLSKHGGAVSGPKRSSGTSKPKKPSTQPSTGGRRLSKKKRAFIAALKANPRALKDMQGLADQIGVTRQTAYNYKKELEGTWFKSLPNGIVIKVSEDGSI